MQRGIERGPTPAFPARVGRYELLLPLGTGGTACVYLARDTGVDGFRRTVALKVMHPHLRDRERVTELFEEAKLTARIRHHHVVPVLDVGEDAEGVFLAMEYVEGGSLSDIVRGADESGARLPAAIAMRILCDALSGLHAAHELHGDDGHSLGLVHRDVSPQNILVGVDGVARLTDFGIAKARSREGVTAEGLIKGKLGYLSPEQARGAAIDRRSDVWAAGVVAWELLAGRRLYGKSDGDEIATLLRIVSEPPPRLRTALPDASPALDEAIARALEPDLEKRWPTALELRARLLAAFGPVADTPDVADYVREAQGQTLATRRAKVDETLRTRGLDARAATTPAVTTVALTPLKARRRSARGPVATVLPLLFLLLASAGVLALFVRSRGSPPSAALVVAGAASLADVPSSAPSTSAEPASPPPPSTATPSSDPSSARPAKSTARPRHGASSPPARASEPRLPSPLGNPYSSAQ